MKGEIKTENLPVPLSEKEMLSHGERIGILLHEIDEIDAKKKAANDLHKTQRERLEAEVRQLGGELKNKAKIQQVQVKEVSNWEQAQIEVVRMDTGEIVRARDMTATERQRTFDVGN